MSTEDEWTVVRTEDGSATLRSRLFGEACHDVRGAWTESCERYARPGEVEAVARGRGVVRLLDVGTGLGWNLAAGLSAARAGGGVLHAVGLEQDPAVVARALELFEAGTLGPEEARLAYAPVAAALRTALTSDGSPVPLADGSLRLLLGDAAETVRGLPLEETFDVVFFDPFSRQRDPASWAPDFVREVAARMAEGARLTTYSASLAFRVELARSGLLVGRGPHVAGKAQGTVAARGGRVDPLDARTARRVQRRSST